MPPTPTVRLIRPPEGDETYSVNSLRVRHAMQVRYLGRTSATARHRGCAERLEREFADTLSNLLDPGGR